MSDEPINTDHLNIEILGLLKDMRREFREHRKDLNDLAKKVEGIEKNLANLVRDAFVDGDIKAHSAWHKKHTSKGFLNRLLRR